MLLFFYHRLLYNTVDASLSHASLRAEVIFCALGLLYSRAMLVFTRLVEIDVLYFLYSNKGYACFCLYYYRLYLSRSKYIFLSQV